jgi:hypothetical protein
MPNEELTTEVSGDSPGAMQLADGGGMTMAPPEDMTVDAQEYINTEALADDADIDVGEEQPPATAVSGEIATFEQKAQQVEDEFLTEEQRKAEEAKGAMTNSEEDYLTAMLETPTYSELKSQAYEEEGVDILETEKNRALTELREEQTRLRRRIEDLQDAGGGLEMGAKAEINNLRRDSLRKQGDMALKIMSLRGEYDAAFKSAERIAQAMYEQEQKNLDYYKTIYQNNKDMWAAQDQRAFETKLADRERELNNARQDEMFLRQTRLGIAQNIQSNGAPLDVISKVLGAQTPEDAMFAAGTYIDQYDRNLKHMEYLTAAKKYDLLSKELSGEGLSTEMREKIGKFEPAQTAVTQINLVSDINRLLGLVKKHGTVNVLDADAKGQIDGLRAQLAIDIAVAGGQGAISDQEADRYAQIIGDGWFETTEKVTNSLEGAIKTQGGKIKSNIELTQATFPGAIHFEPFTEFLLDQELTSYLDEATAEYTQPEETDSKAISSWLINYSSLNPQ